MSDSLRESLGMVSWTDKDLVQQLATRFIEQSVIQQLMTVPVEKGTAFGIELLLVPETNGQRPDDLPRDRVLDAMITEARYRIANRYEHGVFRTDG